MRQLIRNNVFETNSSSVHTLTIQNKGLSGKLKDVDWKIKVGDFLYTYDIYDNPTTILSYLWTMAHVYSVDECSKYIKKMRQWLPNAEFQEISEIVEDNVTYYDLDRYGAGINHGWAWKDEIDRIFANKKTFEKIVFDGKLELMHDSIYVDIEYPKSDKNTFVKGN